MESPVTICTNLKEGHETEQPIRIEFSRYPQWIENEIEIPLK